MHSTAKTISGTANKAAASHKAASMTIGIRISVDNSGVAAVA
jgi:hypothetical protein